VYICAFLIIIFTASLISPLTPSNCILGVYLARYLDTIHIIGNSSIVRAIHLVVQDTVFDNLLTRATTISFRILMQTKQEFPFQDFFIHAGARKNIIILTQDLCLISFGTRFHYINSGPTWKFVFLIHFIYFL
jgi:hypothetical protein